MRPRLEDERAGLTMDRPGVRVSRWIEHAAVLRGLWSDGEFSFAGEHDTIAPGLAEAVAPGFGGTPDACWSHR